MILTLVLVAVGTATGGEQPVWDPPQASLLPQGRYVYQRHCQMCHGARGDGRGDMARTLGIKPRNFRRGLFKFRSTPSGKLPLTSDLRRTVRGGLAHTSMPMFRQLSDRDLTAVLAYVKSFSPAWNHRENYSAALKVPDPPDWLEEPGPDRMTEARRLYDRSCAVCHGPEGAGDGPSAQGLRDAWGQPAPPADLRRPSLKTGPGIQPVYRTLITGLDGTPMPSFLETTTARERWLLVAFLQSLRQPEPVQE